LEYTYMLENTAGLLRLAIKRGKLF